MEARERGIIFNSEMVRAILEGRKSQTRRIVKPQPKSVDEEARKSIPFEGDGEYLASHLVSPFGKPGDRLWVRETYYEVGQWCRSHPEDDEWATWRSSRKTHYLDQGEPPVVGENAWGHTTNEGHRFKVHKDHECYRKVPSIHMPRWASRITLEITNVRVERLQDISEQDAKAEGFVECEDFTPKGAFKKTWNLIYKDWDSNPWVWVVEFKKIN